MSLRRSVQVDAYMHASPVGVLVNIVCLFRDDAQLAALVQGDFYPMQDAFDEIVRKRCGPNYSADLDQGHHVTTVSDANAKIDVDWSHKQ